MHPHLDLDLEHGAPDHLAGPGVWEGLLSSRAHPRLFFLRRQDGLPAVQQHDRKTAVSLDFVSSPNCVKTGPKTRIEASRVCR